MINCVKCFAYIDQGKEHRLSTQHPCSVAMNQYFLKELLWSSDLFENRTDMDSEYYFWLKILSFAIISFAIIESIEIGR